MDKFIYQPVETLENIFSYLPEETLSQLLEDEETREITEKVYASNRFWMLKTELILGYELEYLFSANWRAIYDRLWEMDLEDAFGEASLNGRTEVVALLLQDERVDPSDRDNEAKR